MFSNNSSAFLFTIIPSFLSVMILAFILIVSPICPAVFLILASVCYGPPLIQEECLNPSVQTSCITPSTLPLTLHRSCLFSILRSQRQNLNIMPVDIFKICITFYRLHTFHVQSVNMYACKAPLQTKLPFEDETRALLPSKLYITNLMWKTSSLFSNVSSLT